MANIANENSLFGADFSGHSDRLGEQLALVVEACGGQSYVDGLGSAVGWTETELDEIDEGNSAPSRASLAAFLSSPKVKDLGKDDRVQPLLDFLEETADDESQSPAGATDEKTTADVDAAATDGLDGGEPEVSPVEGEVEWEQNEKGKYVSVTVNGEILSLTLQGKRSVRHKVCQDILEVRRAWGWSTGDMASHLGDPWSTITSIGKEHAPSPLPKERAERWAKAFEVTVAELLTCNRLLDLLEKMNTVPAEATEPEATEPEATEPEATEPEATEPEATEPEATEPEATEPEATEPEATDASGENATLPVEAKDAESDGPGDDIGLAPLESLVAADSESARKQVVPPLGESLAAMRPQSPVLAVGGVDAQARQALASYLDDGQLNQGVSDELARLDLKKIRPDYLNLLARQIVDSQDSAVSHGIDLLDNLGQQKVVGFDLVADMTLKDFLSALR